jgi:hypothetical protein
VALCSFFSSVGANVVGGLAVLAVAYVFVEKRLSLRESHERLVEQDRERESIRERVVTAVLFELKAAAVYVQIWLRELPGGKGIPSPGFDVNGWALVSQVIALTTLDPKTIESLSHCYNRMRSANDQLAFLSDITFGPTAIMAAHLRASLDEDMAATALAAHDEWQAHVRNMLIERCNDLKKHLDNAIDSVEAELGLEVSEPSAQRVYVSQEP